MMEELKGLQMKYFVLNPHKKDTYGEASRSAICQYADSIREENPELAKDLMGWILPIEVKIARENN